MSYGSLLATCLVFFPRSAMACNYNRRCDGERLLLSRDPPEDHIVRARLRGQDNLAVCDGRNLKKMKNIISKSNGVMKVISLDQRRRGG
ncbi:hypothetical protein BD560DRAFT_407719 [Blakeslea trispora]|nr:hypothetical protein BD560DRAFT_407719 [Blakeslea trispora]